MNRLLLLFFITALCCVAVNAQSDWNTYQVRTITSLVTQHDIPKSQKADMVISANPFPSKTKVVFTGRHRPIDVYSKNILKLWAETKNVTAQNLERLKEEISVVENGREFWMPVDSKITPDLLSVLRPNDEVQIYYFFIGGYNEKKIFYKTAENLRTGSPGPDAFKWIFVLERFVDPHPRQTISDSYPAQTLQQAIAKNNDAPQSSPQNASDIWFSPIQTRSKAKLVYTGEVRPLSGHRKALLAAWLSGKGFPADSVSRMLMKLLEARFLEGDNEYWIVMRDTTLNDISQNVKKGDATFVNTILLGNAKNGAALDWLFWCGDYLPN
jgi:hypothetical protein